MAPTMDRTTLAMMAREHWAQWLPEKTAELKKDGELGEATQVAASRAFNEISDLIQQGYRAHEAEEVALKRYILLPPEQPDPDDWEEIERAEAERKYQEMMFDPSDPENEVEPT
jgi:hypothetical protein